MIQLNRQARESAPRDLDERTAAYRAAAYTQITRVFDDAFPGQAFVVDLSRPLIEGGREQAEGFLAFLEEQARSPCPCPICMELLRDARR